MNDVPGVRQSAPEEPSAAAYVVFSTTPEGPSLSVGAPADRSELLFGFLSTATAMGASVLGPFLMARGLAAVGVDSPWLAPGMMLLATLLPLVYVVLQRKNN
ncbi:hypothetical protein ABT354_25265 [Streptomyces sp. NPDC000594]|uniref:hypothetical protein n=1 Tax=Streptomyces sp. NPDC000594 TaxID=3154261 RepID=UPI00332D3250